MPRGVPLWDGNTCGNGMNSCGSDGIGGGNLQHNNSNNNNTNSAWRIGLRPADSAHSLEREGLDTNSYIDQDLLTTAFPPSPHVSYLIRGSKKTSHGSFRRRLLVIYSEWLSLGLRKLGRFLLFRVLWYKPPAQFFAAAAAP